MKKRLFFILILLTGYSLGFAQSISKVKWETILGIGPTGFLGDLGGNKGNGTHFLGDYDFSTTRFNVCGGARFRQPGSRWAFKGTLDFAMVSGNDKQTTNIYRENRNLNFRSPILELSVQAEYYFLGEKGTKQYTISGLKNKKKRNYGVYLFAGVGMFYYNPKEELNDKWYSVRKYHTEGQGLPGGPKQFSPVNLTIPIGLGFRYIISNQWSIGAELSLRKTFTDYIDGVSGRYYNNTAALQTAYGTTAVQLADPSLNKSWTANNADGTGAQRGNPKYKDSYMFFNIIVGYKFVKLHRTRAKF